MASQLTPVLPAWLPRDEDGVTILSCGKAFDAVRVAGWIAQPTLRQLGDRSGPAIEALADGTTYWLTLPGPAREWRLPHVDIYGPGCLLAIPPARSDRALRWRVQPRSDRLTPAAHLYAALAGVLRARHQEVGRA